MKHRLIIVEGLPCSGKSTTAAYAAAVLGRDRCVCLAHEGTGDHPADYEAHALAPAGFAGEGECIVPLRDYGGAQLEALLPYKIYDGLPWERERPLMLDKWRQFVRGAQEDTAYVFNCVLLQNPMCETMMRFDMPQQASQRYISEIAEIIRPMNPLVIYLKTDDIAQAVSSAARERPGWLDAVIDYHTGGAYGRRTGAEGFDGYIACLLERQRRETEILSSLGLEYAILSNPRRDWQAAYRRIEDVLAVSA